MSSVLKGSGFAALAMALGGLAQPAQAAPCTMFAGLQHCPVAGATLSISQGQLVVTGANGSGGVAIATPGASAWSSDSRLKFANGAGDVLTSKSISSGQVTSSTRMLRVPGGYRLSASFTASSGTPTFTTRIYRDGVLVGTETGNPDASDAVTISGPPVLAGWEDLKWPTFNVAQGGSCTWGYQTQNGADRQIKLADGRTFVGDEVRFSEEVQSAGAYPYLTFDALVFEGDLQSGRILSESVQ